MKIATWNINSVRIRIPQLKRLVDEGKPDIICLQETKVEDSYFPLEELKALGYEHIYFFGEKSYNGVAILSKFPLSQIEHMPMAGSTHKRHISARLPDGTALHNFYVPAGGDLPDPLLNPAYDFKLRFVEGMSEWAKTKARKNKHTIIVGDFNIAPLEHDVWSHKQLLNVVSHTPPEVERLNALKDTLNWCDTGRHFTAAEEKLYSWWSYRNRDWRKSNRGRRLDHIWVTPGLTGALKRYETLTDARDWESPSDHVPLMIELTL
ncbi:MAG: exodeoxyribonuclease III [Rickettsiales bacterium]|nr:exodeoxyribonuclease III [Rickettsiales bacterium]